MAGVESAVDLLELNDRHATKVTANAFLFTISVVGQFQGYQNSMVPEGALILASNRSSPIPPSLEYPHMSTSELK